MTGRIEPCAMAMIGFSGTSPTIIAMSDWSGASGTALPAGRAMESPSPGWASVASPMPSDTEISAVPMKRRSARPPTLPRRPMSPTAVIPETSEKKMSGTTSILIARMKRSPIQRIAFACSPSARPARMPRTRAARTRFQSGVVNQAFSIGRGVLVGLQEGGSEGDTRRRPSLRCQDLGGP